MHHAISHKALRDFWLNYSFMSFSCSARECFISTVSLTYHCFAYFPPVCFRYFFTQGNRELALWFWLHNLVSISQLVYLTTSRYCGIINFSYWFNFNLHPSTFRSLIWYHSTRWWWDKSYLIMSSPSSSPVSSPLVLTIFYVDMQRRHT